MISNVDTPRFKVLILFKYAHKPLNALTIF